MAFDVLCKPIKCPEFYYKLRNAVTRNHEVLKKCQMSICKKEYLLALSQEEMEHFGQNPKQYKEARFGVLFEATSGTGEICCYKKLKWNSDILKLSLVHNKVNSRYIINYELVNLPKKVFGYKKVKYDPLSYQYAEKCLYELL